jgi:hypothetical protein
LKQHHTVHEPLLEGGCHQVDRYVVPDESPARDVTALQRQQEEDPVQGIGGAGLCLSEEGLAGPKVRIPERKMAGMPFAGLFLEPGQDLFGKVRAAHPFELAGEGEFPIETRHDQEEEGSDPYAAT